MYWKKASLLFMLVSCCLGVGLYAQTPSKRFVSLFYENDAWVKTDRYYTQGIRLELVSPAFNKLPLAPFSRRFDVEAVVQKGMAVEQDGFTPSTILKDSIPIGDRPYCGSLFISAFSNLFSIKRKAVLTYQLDIGAIGPLALGDEEQTAIHKVTGDALPLGWRYQIQNDLILNGRLSLQRSLWYTNYFDVSVRSVMRLGTLYTDASAGISARTGIKNCWYCSEAGMRLKKIQCFISGDVNVKAVGYNATLQGGLLNRSSIYNIKGNEVERLVLQGKLGASLTYKEIIFSIHRTFLSREFKTGYSHGWGGFRVIVGF